MQNEDNGESGKTEHPFYHYLSEYEDYEQYPEAYNDDQTDDPEAFNNDETDNEDQTDTSGFPPVIDETGFPFSSLDDLMFDNETAEYEYQ